MRYTVATCVIFIIQVTYGFQNYGMTNNGISYELFPSTGPQNERVIIAILRQMHNSMPRSSKYFVPPKAHAFNEGSSEVFDDEEEIDLVSPDSKLDFFASPIEKTRKSGLDEKWMDYLFYSKPSTRDLNPFHQDAYYK